jgi:hypothetical protein
MRTGPVAYGGIVASSGEKKSEMKKQKEICRER